MSQSKTPHIVIVGGGSAGWMCAAFLSHVLGVSGGAGPRITLIESEEVPTLGVGEATVHSLRYFLVDCGIDEVDFMRACDATFKHGILFPGWSGIEGQAAYFHPFSSSPRLDYGTQAEHFVNATLKGADLRWDKCGYVQTWAALAGRGPRRATERPLEAMFPYGYHLDANKLAHFLKGICIQRGVTHVLDHITHVETEGQTIQAVTTAGQQRLAGDLFIDCSGFASLLIKAVGGTFRSFADLLPVDSAVTCRGPLSGSVVRPYTTSTARENGWTFDIDLRSRAGRGYVYSSRHTDQDAALAALQGSFPGLIDEKKANHFKLRIGRMEQSWIGNCVAVGMASGFLEPLESTGLFFIEIALKRMLSALSFEGDQDPGRALFNRTFNASFDVTAEFIAAHYCISHRRDTAFWKDVTDGGTLWPGLTEKLDRWRVSAPSEVDLDGDPGVFGLGSWQAVILGMRYLPSVAPAAVTHLTRDQSLAHLKKVEEFAKEDLPTLPLHAELIPKPNLAVLA